MQDSNFKDTTIREGVSFIQWTLHWAAATNTSVWFQRQTTSTNRIAKDFITKGDPTLLVLTGHQTEGRGRGHNLWDDLPGSSLLSSWVFQTPAPPKHFTSALFGLALFESVSDVWPQIHWSLKAPNDLYVGSKKVAGLLIETFKSPSSSEIASETARTLIVGLGMNIADHPQGLAAATHLIYELESAGGSLKRSDWDQFLSQLFKRFKNTCQRCTHEALDEITCQKLLLALNANPGNKYLAVDSLGNLTVPDGCIQWTEL